jgi:hypothetical protein
MDQLDQFALTLIGAGLLGWFGNALYTRISEYNQNKKILKEVTDQFSQILSNIKGNRSKFKSRVNQTIVVSTTILDHGVVDIISLVDKGDIAIFKDNNCIYTSHTIEKQLIDEIISTIYMKYKKDINDVVEVMGVTISKGEFERITKVNLKDVEKQNKKFLEDQKSDIQKLIEKNNQKLSLDDILDKINVVGYEKLTIEEKEFLKNNS